MTIDCVAHHVDTGNHAKALAFAAQLLSAERGYHIPIAIFMTKHAINSKVRAVAEAGAEVLQHGESLSEARLAAQAFADQRGLFSISPADDRDVMLGQGTVMLEFMNQIHEMGVGALDAVVLPTGGGSLLVGSAIAAHGTDIQIFGSKPSAIGAARNTKMSKDRSSSAFVPSTVADCLQCPVSPFNQSIVSNETSVQDIYMSPEDEIRKAMALFINSTKMLIEPGSAVPLAVVLFNEMFRKKCQQQRDPWKVGVVLTGGNVTLEDSHIVTSHCS